MKVYVCYVEVSCEGSYNHPHPDQEEEPWAAFVDEDEAKKWVEKKLLESEEHYKQHGSHPYENAEYREIELVFGEDWILPCRMGDGT